MDVGVVVLFFVHWRCSGCLKRFQLQVVWIIGLLRVPGWWFPYSSLMFPKRGCDTPRPLGSNHQRSEDEQGVYNHWNARYLGSMKPFSEDDWIPRESVARFFLEIIFLKPCHEKRDSELKKPSILQVLEPLVFGYDLWVGCTLQCWLITTRMTNYRCLNRQDFLEQTDSFATSQHGWGIDPSGGVKRYSMMMLGAFVPIKNTGSNMILLGSPHFPTWTFLGWPHFLRFWLVAPHKTKADPKWGEKGKSSANNFHRKRKTFRWGGVPTPFWMLLVEKCIKTQWYLNLWFIDNFWSNYSDLTRPHPKWWFSKGNPLISGKSGLVKYYNLTR